MITKCNLCDERGHIQDTPHSSHSCPCGKYNRQMEAIFKNVSIEQLLNYGRARVIEKGKQIYG
jgi:hypothetical protein